MVSNTKKTCSIRARHVKRMGKKRKQHMRRHGTPTFPVHPAGYDPSAADAKPTKAAAKA